MQLRIDLEGESGQKAIVAYDDFSLKDQVITRVKLNLLHDREQCVYAMWIQCECNAMNAMWMEDCMQMQDYM